MIKTLKEVGTNNILYPKTDVSAVLKENGESIEASLIPDGGRQGQILQYTENGVSWGFPFENYTDILAYGVEWDATVADPACTRVGNMSLHKTLPIQSQMRGCLLNDDGKVVRYLDPNDWTSEVRDGSEGQVMVEVPMHYRRFVTNGTKRRVMLSEYPLPGYHQVPLMYQSAYQATVQRSTQKLASVRNFTEDYRGGTNHADWDGLAKSELGKPAGNLNLVSSRKYARNRKAGSSEWNALTYEAWKELYWLFVVEYATRNSQAPYNAEPTAEGYKQGGLGEGVVNINYEKWKKFNNFNPFIPCGYTDALGNGTGEVEYTMPTEFDESGVVTKVPRYRGIENPFGHVWQWVDGVLVRISANVENGSDGLSKIYVCSDPNKFSSTISDGYHHLSNESRQNGYIKDIIFREAGDIIAMVCTGGSSTTYYCDYHLSFIPTSGETLRGLIVGNSAYGGSNAGLIFSDTRNVPEYTAAYFGSRLCFIPQLIY